MGDTVAFSLFIYVMASKAELTYQGATLFIIGGLMLIFQVFLIFTKANFNSMVFIFFAEIFFAYYIIYDTQTNVSGSNYNWSKDCWISGAVVIYVDIFILFLRLCELMRQLIIRERN